MQCDIKIVCSCNVKFHKVVKKQSHGEVRICMTCMYKIFSEIVQ